MNEVILFFAVNRSGQGLVFSTIPVRDERRKVWVGDINAAAMSFIGCLETVYGFSLPDISWKDEPVTITIRIGYD